MWPQISCHFHYTKCFINIWGRMRIWGSHSKRLMWFNWSNQTGIRGQWLEMGWSQGSTKDVGGEGGSQKGRFLQAWEWGWLSVLERRLQSEMGLFHPRETLQEYQDGHVLPGSQGDKGCSPKGICHLSFLRRTHSDGYIEVPGAKWKCRPLTHKAGIISNYK